MASKGPCVLVSPVWSSSVVTSLKAEYFSASPLQAHEPEIAVLSELSGKAVVGQLARNDCFAPSHAATIDHLNLMGRVKSAHASNKASLVANSFLRFSIPCSQPPVNPILMSRS